MTAYPLIGAGSNVPSQYPYTEIDEHVVSESSLDCGASFTHYENPSMMRRFVITYTTIKRSELTTIENFFDSMGGPLGEFTYTDDSGFTWGTVSFDQDRLEVTYPNPGQYALTAKLRAQP